MAEAGPRLTVWLRLALNFWSSCPYLSSAGRSHCARLTFFVCSPETILIPVLFLPSIFTSETLLVIDRLLSGDPAMQQVFNVPFQEKQMNKISVEKHQGRG